MRERRKVNSSPYPVTRPIEGDEVGFPIFELLKKLSGYEIASQLSRPGKNVIFNYPYLILKESPNPNEIAGFMTSDSQFALLNAGLENLAKEFATEVDRRTTGY